MTIESLNLWHKRARPEPTEESFNVQLGCHLEEIVEMLETLHIKSDGGAAPLLARAYLTVAANDLKNGKSTATVFDRKEFLDSLADQIVTAVGVAHCAKMDIVAACEEVNKSNWSKFNYKGFPEFNENGKIKKGSNYQPPNLEGMY